MLLRIDTSNSILDLNYNNAYAYNFSQPHTVRSAGNYNFAWDNNGNMTHRTANNEEGKWRNLCWDEENRLMGVIDFHDGLAHQASAYVYNAGGERVWKLTGGVEQLSLNGREYYDVANLTERTLYASPYLVANGQNYTKHYFIETERVCSKIGGGFGSIDPMSNWVEPIEGDIMNLSDNLTAHVANSLSCSYDNALVQLEPQLNGIEDFINLNQTEDLLYFTHSDHLGSSSFITDLSGEAVQHLQYLPFGESFVTQTSSAWQTRYTFSGKEKDAETGYNYFGARYYDSDLSVWLSVDPLAGKYPSMSAYMYVAGNPVMLVDPDGQYLIIWYMKDGKQVSFKFDGTNFSSAPKNPFVQAVLTAYKYNVANGGGSALKEAATSLKYNVNISYSELYDGAMYSNVYWNPELGLKTTDGYILSPATVLEHEVDHALSQAKDSDAHFERRKNDGSVWDNKEEKRVIQGNETKTAKANKEIPVNKKYSRNNHKGSDVIVDGGPTSTKVNNLKTKEHVEKLEKAPKWTPEY